MRMDRVLMRHSSTRSGVSGMILLVMSDLVAILIVALGFGALFGARACLAALMPALEDRR